MLPFAHVFAVDLECHRAVRAERERRLVVQADDVPAGGAAVAAEHLPQRVERAQRAQPAQREQVQAGVEARLRAGARRLVTVVNWRTVVHTYSGADAVRPRARRPSTTRTTSASRPRPALKQK